VVWERATGRPIAKRHRLQDRRTAGLCEQLRSQGVEALFTGRTGLLLDAYFSEPKCAGCSTTWRARARRAEKGALAFGTVDTWLIWKLTGGPSTPPTVSNASRTMMFNIHTRDWDDKLLGLAARAARRCCRRSSRRAQSVANAIRAFRSWPSRSPACRDQQAALFGQQCTTFGMVKNTYGNRLLHADTYRRSPGGFA